LGAWNVTAERIFAQTEDPGAVGAGAIWSDTNANITYRRNDTNTDWIPTTISLGTARQVLAVNSGASALEYVSSMQSLLTASGDTIYASAANTPARLAKGTDGQVLTLASGVPSWAAAGATVTTQEAVKTSNQTVTSTYPTFADVTTLTLTMPTRTNGKALVSFVFTYKSDTLAAVHQFRVMDNGVAQEEMATQCKVANARETMTINYVTTLSGQVVKLQAAAPISVNILIYGVAEDGQSYVNSLEVS